ncbi:MAG: DMT family transporter [Thermoplasmatales archaeon]|nr:DMT family transporter [Thermoplasmatales archaeon]
MRHPPDPMERSIDGSGTATSVVLFLTMTIAWGINYIFVVIGLDYVTPLWLAGLRAAVGAIVVFAFLRATHHPRVLDAAGRRDALIVGLPTTAAFLGLWFYAAASVPAGETAILIYTFPLWVALLSPWVLGHPLSGRHWLAIGIGFAGVVLISQPWSLGAGAQRRFPSLNEMSEANVYQMAGGAAALVAAAIVVNHSQLPVPSPVLGLVLVWIGVVGTGFAYIVWYRLLSRIRAATLSAYTFVVPMITVIASSIVFQERFTASEATQGGHRPRERIDPAVRDPPPG